jgi:hypothetical protein
LQAKETLQIFSDPGENKSGKCLSCKRDTKRNGGNGMAIQIQKAKRQMARLKIGVAGSSGSGKT